MDNLDYETLQQQNRELKEQLRFFNDFDLLTGIYNKSAFYKAVEEILYRYPGEKFQIICTDVERFKVVNDLYGTEQGDILLQYLAKGLKEELPAVEQCIGRVGADIFAVLLTQDEGGEKAIEIIQKIFKSCSQDMEIVPAIGVYMIEDCRTPVSIMCDRGILALNSIKGDYMRHAAVYEDYMRNILLEEQELLNGVDAALKNRDFEIYMQPKCNMRTGKVTGAEALVRWNHPLKGMIPPKDFIPIFEKNGFIKKLDHYVWEETAAWLHDWVSRGNRPIPISVNVSRVDIFGMDVCGIFQNLAEKYNLDSTWLELEITESAYSSRTDEIILVINRLMKDGFTVLMDDFGSGYSSLNILKDISIDVLKLDMRFLDSTDNKSKDILESVVHMAHWLNLKVIAEGVEDRQQVEFLLGVGCTYAQGYYYYRPMPISEFEQLLTEGEMIDFDDVNIGGDVEKLITLKDIFYEDTVSEVMLNNILGAVALYSFDGQQIQILRCNESYYRLMGFDAQPDTADKNALDSIAEEDRPLMCQAIVNAMTSGDEGAEVIVRKNCRERGLCWFRVRLFFLSAVNGKDIFYSSVSDMTDYMENLESLRLSQQRFRIAMEASSDTIFEVDIKTKVARYTERSKEEFGLEDCVANAPEGFIEQGSVCAGYEQAFCDMYQAIYRGEDKASCEIQAHMGNDSIVWNRITLTAVKDKAGNSVKAVGLVENITKEKELELKLGQK